MHEELAEYEEAATNVDTIEELADLLELMQQLLFTIHRLKNWKKYEQRK